MMKLTMFLHHLLGLKVFAFSLFFFLMEKLFLFLLFFKKSIYVFICMEFCKIFKFFWACDVVFEALESKNMVLGLVDIFRSGH